MRYCLICLCLLMMGSSIYANPPSQQLIDALIQVESGGDDGVIGDNHLANKAYGCLQIRQPCVDDYNRWHNTAFKAADCLNDPHLSVKICKDYIDHYASETRLGRMPTDEDKARIWNGGPNGFKKDSTKGYWSRVSAKLR